MQLPGDNHPDFPVLRFRTCFPTEYRKNTSSADGRTPGSEKPASQHEFKNSKYPPKPTKTELEHAELVEKLGLDRHFPKAQRRERREFTAEEDCSLLAGFDLVRYDLKCMVALTECTRSTAHPGQRFRVILPSD